MQIVVGSSSNRYSFYKGEVVVIQTGAKKERIQE